MPVSHKYLASAFLDPWGNIEGAFCLVAWTLWNWIQGLQTGDKWSAEFHAVERSSDYWTSLRECPV